MPLIEQTFVELRNKAEQVRYGTYNVQLIIHQGRVIGFDQLKEPVIRFREEKNNNK